MVTLWVQKMHFLVCCIDVFTASDFGRTKLLQDKTIATTKQKVIDLTARSMSRNVIITGLLGDKDEHLDKNADSGQKEDCKQEVLSFLHEKVMMEVEDAEIEVAHRMGKMIRNKSRPMVVRCAQSLRDRIFNFTSNLKDKQNEQGDSMLESNFLNPWLLKKEKGRTNSMPSKKLIRIYQMQRSIEGCQCKSRTMYCM